MTALLYALAGPRTIPPEEETPLRGSIVDVRLLMFHRVLSA